MKRREQMEDWGLLICLGLILIAIAVLLVVFMYLAPGQFILSLVVFALIWGVAYLISRRYDPPRWF